MNQFVVILAIVTAIMFVVVLFILIRNLKRVKNKEHHLDLVIRRFKKYDLALSETDHDWRRSSKATFSESKKVGVRRGVIHHEERERNVFEINMPARTYSRC